MTTCPTCKTPFLARYAGQECPSCFDQARLRGLAIDRLIRRRRRAAIAAGQVPVIRRVNDDPDRGFEIYQNHDPSALAAIDAAVYADKAAIEAEMAAISQEDEA